MKEKEVNDYLELYTNFIAQQEELDINYSLSRRYFDSVYLITNIVDSLISYDEEFDLNKYDPNDFRQMDLFSKIDWLKIFFDQINYKVNIDEKINNGELNPVEYKFDSNEKNKWIKYLDANGGSHGKNRTIHFKSTNLALDTIIMSHELGHSANETNDNYIKSAISEAISIYIELNANDFMRNEGYDKEAEFMEYVRANSIKFDIHNVKNALELYNVYVKYGKVTKESYEKEYTENYENVINSIVNESDFFKMDLKLEYILGMFLACYMYGRVKEDFSFTENINIASKNLKNERNDSFDNILSILQINSLDKQTIMILSEYFKSYIDNYLIVNKKTNSK